MTLQFRFRRRHMAGLCLVVLTAALTSASPQTQTISITLAGQSMIRSDIRETAPSSVTATRSILKGDVIFTNVEAAVAEKGESVHEGRGFLTPPEERVD